MTSCQRDQLKWLGLTFAILAFCPAPSAAQTSSSTVTWTCTDDPCPWGGELEGEALVWPQTDSWNRRLGYSTSQGVYLPAQSATGLTVSLTSGEATVYVGLPDAPSHRPVATISAGGFYTIESLAAGEVVSVQSDGAFSFGVSASAPEPPSNSGALSSSVAQWTCAGTPCPWGSVLVGYAFAWNQFPEATSNRLGYSVSAPVYLPATIANRLTITGVTGTMSLYAGLPDAASHRHVATLYGGQLVNALQLGNGEVLSVQSDEAFTLQLILGPPEVPGTPGDAVGSISARWRCNNEECTWGDWEGAVINWPSWAAYENNARSGQNSRTVYAESGELVYPYMGSWANGCEVTALSGSVLIIEWQRGTDVWRETLLSPGQTHTIQLVSPENGAMIEAPGTLGFSVRLHNCTPQAVPK